jgi:hypothetical protein
LQTLFQRLPAGYPWSGLLMRNNMAADCPTPMMSSVIKVGSANTGAVCFSTCEKPLTDRL